MTFDRPHLDSAAANAHEASGAAAGAPAVSPRNWTPEEVLRLQRGAGNAAVVRLLQRQPGHEAPPAPAPPAGAGASDDIRSLIEPDLSSPAAQAFLRSDAAAARAQERGRAPLRALALHRYWLSAPVPVVALSITSVGPVPSWAAAIAQGGGPPSGDPSVDTASSNSEPAVSQPTYQALPHPQSHLQFQAAVAGNIASTGNSAAGQGVMQVLTQFHDDAHWGLELSEGVQGNVNGTPLAGVQANIQLAIASAVVRQIQDQVFAQLSIGDSFDPRSPSASLGSATHPFAQVQVGAQRAVVLSDNVQIFIQITAGVGVTTGHGGLTGPPMFFAQGGIAAGITFDVGRIDRHPTRRRSADVLPTPQLSRRPSYAQPVVQAAQWTGRPPVRAAE
jgi:hypothetical protein